MADLSIFMPAIRKDNWNAMYDSISQSCKKYSWELVMCGPFPLTSYLQQKNNVKMVEDFGSPSRAAMIAYFETRGKLIYHVVDDAHFLPDRIDEAIDLYNSLNNNKAIINMKYIEGKNYSGQSMRVDYWHAWGHDGLRLSGIPRHYKISLHHLMDSQYFFELGGYDCKFIYQNFNLHDFIFRAQYDGATVIDSLRDVTSCDHSQKDHKVIEEVHHEHDQPLFNKIYNNPNALKEREKIDINNWAEQSSLWKRFEKGIPKQYSDLVEK